MTDDYEIEWWEEWLNADELKRFEMVEKLPFYNFCKDINKMKDEKLIKHSFATRLNSYFSDLESAVYTKLRLENKKSEQLPKKQQNI